MLGGGFVFAQVITFRILNPCSVRILAIEKMLWYVPLTHIVRAIVFQLLAALVYPCPIERVHVFRRSALIPLSLVHADHLAALHTYTSIAKEVGRVGKYHVELETELLQQFDTIAVEEGKGAVGGTKIGGNHFFSFIGDKSI